MARRTMIWVGAALAGALFAIAAVVALVVALGVGPGRPEAVEITWDELSADHRAIRIRGMAHYNGKLKATQEGTFGGETTWWLFPFFPEHDTESRGVLLIVRTTREPEDMVGFEYLELEGWLSLPDRFSVPLQAEYIMSRETDYYFREQLLVIEPWRITPYEPGEIPDPTPDP